MAGQVVNSQERRMRRRHRGEVKSLHDKGVPPNRIALRVGIEKKAVKKILRKANLGAQS